MFTHIFVPLDGSTLAERALPQATALAQAYDSTITLFRVPESLRLNAAELVVGFPDAADFYTSASRAALLDAETYLDLTREQLADQERVNVLVSEGSNVAEAILTQAKAVGADLIVMSTHGYHGVKRVLLGSVAERVARHATMPVMLISAE